MSPLNKAGMYSSDDVALAETIERLIKDDDNAHLGMSTYQHLLQYIMSELRH